MESTRARAWGRARRLFAIAAASAVTAFAGSLLAASPSHAATGWDRCPDGTFCIFEHANGQGRMAYFIKGSSDLAVPIGGFVFNDKTTSYWNRTAKVYWSLFNARHYEERMLGVNDTFKHNLPTHLNDRVSSLRVL